MNIVNYILFGSISNKVFSPNRKYIMSTINIDFSYSLGLLPITDSIEIKIAKIIKDEYSISIL